MKLKQAYTHSVAFLIIFNIVKTMRIILKLFYHSLLFDRIRSERNQSNSGASESNQARPSASGSNTLTGANSLSAQISSVSAEREAFSRWRDRQYYVPRRWPNIDDYVWDKEGGMSLFLFTSSNHSKF